MSQGRGLHGHTYLHAKGFQVLSQSAYCVEGLVVWSCDDCNACN